MTKHRFFRGYDTRQVDYNGSKAEFHKWYYEPTDYDGDVLWSIGYSSFTEAAEAANRANRTIPCINEIIPSVSTMCHLNGSTKSVKNQDTREANRLKP